MKKREKENEKGGRNRGSESVMKNADQWSGLALLILGALIGLGSARLPYGNVHNPGPGFLPLWLGVILGVMALALLLKATWPKEGSKMLREILGERGISPLLPPLPTLSSSRRRGKRGGGFKESAPFPWPILQPPR